MYPLRDPALALAAGEGEAFWLAGSLVTIRVRRDLTGNALAVCELLTPVGFGLPPRIHHVEDLIITGLAGEIAGRCGGESWRCGPGGLVFLPRGVAHDWCVVGDGPAHLLVVATPAGFERFCAAAGEPAVGRDLPRGGDDAAALGRLLAVAPRYGVEVLAG